MFTRILVPLDGSQLAETVLPHLIVFGKGLQNHSEGEGKIALLRVLDPMNGVTQAYGVDPLDWQMRKAEAESYLQGIATRLRQSGLKSSVEVREGKPAEVIVRYAEDIQADLILLSSHGQSGISGWNVSSVVQKIIHLARISIFIVRAYQTEIEQPGADGYQRILVPMDGSQRAESVLPIANFMARTHEAELIVAHVVQRPEMARRTPLSDEDLELSNRITERNRIEAEKYLSELQGRLDVPVTTRVLIDESILRALHNLVESEKISLVIMSAHGYTGDRKWRYGSTVISFIAYGTVPLLIFQDFPAEAIEPTTAELSAQKYGGR